MKKILLLALLLIPVLSFGQKFEVIETAGMGWNKQTGTAFFSKSGAFTNQVSFNYYLTKHLSAGIYHAFSSWAPQSNTFGLAADGHFGHFSIGVDAGKMYTGTKITTFYGDGYYAPNGAILSPSPITLTVKPNPALVLGAHASLDQKLAKHFFLKEQVAYNYATTKGTAYGDQYSSRIRYVSALVGVGFRF